MRIFIKIAAKSLIGVGGFLLFFSCGERNQKDLSFPSLPKEFSIRLFSEPASLDPHLTDDLYARILFLAFFEGLFSFDPSTSLAVPALVKSLEVDGNTYTFFLRETTWSDGTPLTSEVFLRSWLRLLAPETASPLADWLTRFVEGADPFHRGETGPESLKVFVRGPNILQVTFKEGHPPIPDLLAQQAFLPLPLHLIEKVGPRWTDPNHFVGNGPFLLAEYSLGSQLVGRRNRLYWDASRVSLDSLRYFIISDANTSFRMFKNGEIDWARRGLPIQYSQQARQLKGFHSTPLWGVSLLLLNTRKAPLTDPKIRKALALAIDPHLYMRSAWESDYLPPRTLVPPLEGYDPPPPLPYSPQQAKALLKSAGYSEDRSFPPLVYLYVENPYNRAQAEFFQQQWRENVNVEVSLEARERISFWDSLRTGDYQMAQISKMGEYLDPLTFLEPFLTDSLENYAGWSSPLYDHWIFRASQESLPSERRRFLSKAEQLLLHEETPIIPLFPLLAVDFIDLSKWGGWFLNPLDIHSPKTIFRKNN